MNENEAHLAQPFARRARKVFYHPNGKGTGAALQLELHPAHEDIEGSVFLTLAPQKSIGMKTDTDTVHPTFDWRTAICLKLGLMDLAQILQVLRGMQESLADGKGLFHRSVNATTVIKFEHRIEPRPGYAFDVWKKPHDGDQQHYYFTFDPSEAFFLMLALEQSAGVIAFGIPQVIPRAKTYENVHIATPVAANDPF